MPIHRDRLPGTVEGYNRTFPELDGVVAPVRQEQHPVAFAQRAVVRQRLLLEHVEPGDDPRFAEPLDETEQTGPTKRERRVRLSLGDQVFVTGNTGIICSVQTSGWSFGTRATRSGGSPAHGMPAASRITLAFLPIRSFSSVARCRLPGYSLNITLVTLCSSFSVSTRAPLPAPVSSLTSRRTRMAVAPAGRSTTSPRGVKT